jgi:cell division septal protein FtsQ
MSDKHYKSTNLIKRKKKILRLKILGFFISLFLIIASLVYFSNADFVKIQDVYINETVFFDNQEVEKIIREELEGQNLFFFGRNNIVFLPQKNIKKRIKDLNSSIKNISLKINNLHAISVNIEEYIPVALWCNDLDCYYLNEKGLVFEKALGSYDINLTKFNDFLKDNPKGQIYINSETFKKLITLISLVAKVPLKIVSVDTEDGLTFNLHTETRTKLLYESSSDPEEVASNLNTVLEKDAINRAQLNNIDYIDLRFGNKVYYKIR